MLFLARFRILPKILAIILFMAAIASGIAWVGSSALSELNGNADNMAAAAKRSLEAARASQNVLAMNRAEFRSALDPRPENREAARKVIQDNLKHFEEAVTDLSKNRNEKVRAMIPEVKTAFGAYQKTLENTLRLVDAASDAQLSDVTLKLRDAAMASRGAAEELQGRLKAVSDELNSRAESLAKVSTAEYETASREMIVLSIVGVLVGLLFGFLIGQYGVAKPIRAVVDLLQKLAAGHFEIDIGGVDRKDEVGDVARTALVFKENGIAKARMEAEQKEAEQRVAVQRKQDMMK